MATKKKSRKGKPHVTDQVFKKTYNSSKSVKEVAAKLGVSVVAVYTRADRWRAQGVTTLKTFADGRKGGNRKINVDALNATTKKSSKPAA